MYLYVARNFPIFDAENAFMESSPHPLILYLPRWYPTTVDPMLGLFVRKHALAAVAGGYRVVVVFVQPGLPRRTKGMFSTEVIQTGDLTEVIVTYRRESGPAGMARQLTAWNLGVITAEQHCGKPSLIHAHVLTRTALLAWYFGRKWKIPYVITEHWSRYFAENRQYTGFVRKYLTRFAVRRAAETTCVSHRLAGAMQQCGVGQGFSLLPNVIDTDMFTIGEKRAEDPLIVSVTCFEEKSKNLKMLIDAFVMLRSVHKNARLMLIGTGADLPQLEKYVRTLQLPAAAVTFTGLLEHEALVARLQQASCLALSSNYETFGIVAYEALACGVPVVATDVADLRSFLEPDMGITVPVGDVKAFAGALLQVHRNLQQYNAATMRAKVETHFGFAAVSKQLSDLYHRLLNKNG